MVAVSEPCVRSFTTRDVKESHLTRKGQQVACLLVFKKTVLSTFCARIGTNIPTDVSHSQMYFAKVEHDHDITAVEVLTQSSVYVCCKFHYMHNLLCSFPILSPFDQFNPVNKGKVLLMLISFGWSC